MCGCVCVSVGRMVFHVQIRDCMTLSNVKRLNFTSGTNCLINQAKLEAILRPLMPHSVLSMHPTGKLCYCSDDRCVDFIEKSDIFPVICSETQITLGEKHW